MDGLATNIVTNNIQRCQLAFAEPRHLFQDELDGVSARIGAAGFVQLLVVLLQLVPAHSTNASVSLPYSKELQLAARQKLHVHVVDKELHIVEGGLVAGSMAGVQSTGAIHGAGGCSGHGGALCDTWAGSGSTAGDNRGR